MAEPIRQDEPVVSVVVAAFQAHDYLRQAIASALGQRFARLEVVVSDDAGDPAVERMVASFADPRVKYRRNPQRLGPAGNHWAAFADARGTYLAVLNHDDLWQPDFLGTLVPALENDPGLVLAFCDHTLIDSDGNRLADATDENTRRWGRDRLPAGVCASFPEIVIRQSIPLAMGAVFRRSALDLSTLPAVGPAYDLWLAYALCRTGGRAWYTPARLTAWRVHPSQLTQAGVEAWSAGSLFCWQAMARDPLFQGCRPEVACNVARSAVALARSRLRRGDAPGSRASAALALMHRPTDWRALALLALSLLPGRAARAMVRGGTPAPVAEVPG